MLSVEISPQTLNQIQFCIQTFWKLAETKSYQQEILNAEIQPSAPIMAYDFHLQNQVPKLIEINTNAAGLLLANQFEMGNTQIQPYPGKKLDSKLNEIFRLEFDLQSHSDQFFLADQNVQEQFYYPEFVLLQKALKSFDMQIIESTELEKINLKNARIYWRDTDFTLEKYPALKSAYQKQEIKLSPTLEIYELLSNKARMLNWSHDIFIKHGLSPDEAIKLNQLLLSTGRIKAQNSDDLWKTRKSWVFKPTNKFGGKGVYMGKSLSQKKWLELCSDSSYIYQEYCTPISLKPNPADDESTQEIIQTLKFDLRAYAWKNEMLLLIARGYTGQMTSFRSPYSGFYPVKIHSSPV